jgi:hypothetical protein
MKKDSKPIEMTEAAMNQLACLYFTFLPEDIFAFSFHILR